MSLICKDGHTVPTEYYGSLIEGVEPDTNYVVAVGRDITERWQAEQALSESVEKLRSLSNVRLQLPERRHPWHHSRRRHEGCFSPL